MALGGCASKNRQDGHRSRHRQNDSEVASARGDIVVIRLWGCLTLAGLLLAGCSFNPGGSSGSDPGSDAGGGFSDGLPDPDGGSRTPDAAGADAAPVEPVLLETLAIDVASEQTVQSTVVLLSGRTYRLVASGEAVVRDDDLGRYMGDADYWWGGIFDGEDSYGGVDYGLAINDIQVDGSRSPDWGEFADSHVYETTMPGNDSVLSALFFDSNYGNGNSGSLSLEIWGPP